MVASIPPLSTQESSNLKQLHADFGHKVLLTGCTTAAASFLIIGALIVIFSASLCFMLPGVNVIRDIIQPAIIPGVAGIIASIPLIILTVKNNREKNTLRETMITEMINHLEKYNIPNHKEKTQVHFILRNFLNWQPEGQKSLKNTSWTDDYQKKIIGEIKEKFGDDKEKYNKRQKRMVEGLDAALVKISKKKK
jgi:hypothetical protein